MNLLLAEVAQATQRLADAGVPSPRFDAEELAAYVHGVKRGELHTVPDPEFDARYWEAVARREAREPSSTSPAAPSSAIWSSRSGRGSSYRAPRPRAWWAGR